ncbi:putative PB1 domain-containing protein [Helianthus annuus]|uniref:PB1 domain-containing protein n=2 Tax=Helianthus annuus TaxID=4232 RepID=A0A9K3EIJ4_HELAN|nr:putative PB1 domain-containing protein [Helianthus annuus]KAJ0477550.1 putative PB1 domain-containing protein [Helianthus annuus]KAJ0482045.1 putative PB1 domain-containing protein [Helianthus annuus]KAJ0498380.1 putative PB1 domain-containing protein [Helianthus annuus]KAJ0664390.1 putative PB1 domain-containing protein [Helianthus annuus]
MHACTSTLSHKSAYFPNFFIRLNMATPSSSNKKIKFYYGYGGTITPSKSSGKLRYEGGTNGILKVDRGITYTELVVKLWDACGPSMLLRCKLPHDDLDSLVNVRSDEDLAYVLEEYDQCSEDLKIRAILDDTLRFSWASDQLYCFRPKDFLMQVHTVEASR